MTLLDSTPLRKQIKALIDVQDVQVRLRKAIALLTPADVAVDCGANVGLFTKKMADRGCTVHAFEPDPDAFAILQEKLAGRENVHLHHKAISDRAGTCTLYRLAGADVHSDISATQSSSLMRDKLNVNLDRAVEVETIDFSRFVLNLDRPISLLKMDVEGSEAIVLRSLIDEDLIKHIGVAFVETHEHRVPSIRAQLADVRRELDDAGAGHIFLDWV